MKITDQVKSYEDVCKIKNKKMGLKQFQDQDYNKLGKGFHNPAPNEKVYQTRDTLTGKRKVKVLDQPPTWVYTSCKTDEEVIAKFNKRMERRGEIDR